MVDFNSICVSLVSVVRFACVASLLLEMVPSSTGYARALMAGISGCGALDAALVVTGAAGGFGDVIIIVAVVGSDDVTVDVVVGLGLLGVRDLLVVDRYVVEDFVDVGTGFVTVFEVAVTVVILLVIVVVWCSTV